MHFSKAVLTGALLLMNVAAQETVFHVSVEGDDERSGSASVREEGNNGPFQTLPRAIAAVRQARAETPQADIRIVLAPGRYEIDEPLRITAAEAGLGSLTIEAAGEGDVVVSGGRVLQGDWKRSDQNRNIWELEIPEVRNGEWFFRTLFVNGKRKTRARTPNDGFFRIQGASPQDKPVRIHYQEEDIQKRWAESGEVELIALLAWADIRMQIREVDSEAKVATLSGDPRPSNRENNARYYVENAREFLDSPGEWFLDRQSGVLSYWPEEGEDLRAAEVIAPRLEDLVIVEGDVDAGKMVRNLTLRGITFSHTDWQLGSNGYADTQAAISIGGDLRVTGAEDGVIEDCRFAHLAGYAVELGRGVKRFRVAGNEMTDLGAGGIRLGEMRIGSEAEANDSHEVTDNHIHKLGRVFPPAVGIFILQSGTNRVAHNHIHDLFYTAVSVGWNWGYQETPCRENVIEYNHMHDIGQRMLSDMGAVYTLGIQRGTVVRNNLIHDVSAFTYGGWGLYTDEGSSFIVMENNVVYRCKNAGFHQHYGRENVIRNNIFAFNVENQVMRTRPEDHTSFYFTNNIVYFDSGNLLGSNWSNDNYSMEHNVYWDTRLADHPERMRFAGATWQEWQARGHDRHSVLADPLFVSPAKQDFSLRPNSPALKLGFQPIDLNGVGVRPGEKRK